MDLIWKTSMICRARSVLWKSPLTWLIFFSAVGFLLVAYGPLERSLGTHVRVVYLHGAWVWASIALFASSAATGLLALSIRQTRFHDWSRALGRTGLFFWITYLPVSLWAMQTNWNGLYLSEPRWRLAVIFAITGPLLQIGITLIDRPVLTSAANLVFFIVLMVSISGTREIMHPRSPIFTSDSRMIQIYFCVLVVTMLLIGWQIARGWLLLEQKTEKSLSASGQS
jgi:hypothetical protein